MEGWTDEFIHNAQQELVAMVKDWQFDYGPSDDECAAMLLWMVLRLKPDLNIGIDEIDSPRSDHIASPIEGIRLAEE